MLGWLMDLLWGKSQNQAVGPVYVLTFTNPAAFEDLAEEDLARIKKRFEEEYSGAHRGGRMIIAPPGTDIKLLK